MYILPFYQTICPYCKATRRAWWASLTYLGKMATKPQLMIPKQRDIKSHRSQRWSHKDVFTLKLFFSCQQNLHTKGKSLLELFVTTFLPD